MHRTPAPLLLPGFLLLSVLPGLTAWDWTSQPAGWTEDPAFRSELNWGSPDSRALAAALFFQLNDLRVMNGKAPMVYHQGMESAGVKWARHLSERNLLDQDPSLAARMTEAGAGPGSFGELVSQTASPSGLTILQMAREMADIWYSSPAHRAVLLRDDLAAGACGVWGKVQGSFFETRAVFSFRLKPRETPAPSERIVPVSAPPADPAPVLKTEPPGLNWGTPVTGLRNPRFFGSWTGGREAFRVDFSLETLLGQERPQWILGITRPRTKEFSALFIKITGKKSAGLLTRFRTAYGDPSSTTMGTVDADTEPARIYTWAGTVSELRLYEGETHTYVRLSER